MKAKNESQEIKVSLTVNELTSCVGHSPQHFVQLSTKRQTSRSSFYVYESCSFKNLKNLPKGNLLVSGRAGTETPTLIQQVLSKCELYDRYYARKALETEKSNTKMRSPPTELAHLVEYTNKRSISTMTCSLSRGDFNL